MDEVKLTFAKIIIISVITSTITTLIVRAII